MRLPRIITGKPRIRMPKATKNKPAGTPTGRRSTASKRTPTRRLGTRRVSLRRTAVRTAAGRPAARGITRSVSSPVDRSRRERPAIGSSPSRRAPFLCERPSNYAPNPNIFVTVKMARPTSPPTSVPLMRMYWRSLPNCNSIFSTNVSVSQRSTIPVTNAPIS